MFLSKTMILNRDASQSSCNQNVISDREGRDNDIMYAMKDVQMLKLDVNANGTVLRAL